MRHAVIVDAHVHLWDLERNPQPWITAEHAPIARTFGPDDLEPLLAAAGVDAVVVVQGACYDADTDYLLELAGDCGWIAAVTAWVDLLDRRQTDSRLDQLSAHGKLRAVRHLVQSENDRHWLTSPPVLSSLALLQERGLILEVPAVFPLHLDDVCDLARLFPRLRIVVDHLGKPPIGTDRMRDWETDLRAVAAHPNVFAKVSGLNTALRRSDWRPSDLRPAVEVALDAFGPGRLLCGSDWPVALLNGTYETVWTATREIVATLAGPDEALLLGATAADLYDLAPTATRRRPSAEEEM